MNKDRAAILEALREAAAVGTELARSEFDRRGFEMERKADGSPVTSADVRVERAIKASLAERLSDIPLVGEESADEQDLQAGRYIAIDPIDGTSNFMRGVPFFALTVVYVEEARPVAGVVMDVPRAVGYWAVRGEGAYRDGERLQVARAHTSLDRATVALAAESLPAALQGEFLSRIARTAHRVQALRSVALEIVGLASGWIDAAVFNRVAVWDIAAASLVLEEAGGRWTELDGSQPELSDIRRRYSFLGASDPELQREIQMLVRQVG